MPKQLVRVLPTWAAQQFTLKKPGVDKAKLREDPAREIVPDGTKLTIDEYGKARQQGSAAPPRIDTLHGPFCNSSTHLVQP